MGTILSIALLIAVAAYAWKKLRAVKLDRAIAALPGGSAESAVEVQTFSEIDEHMARRHCPCGGGLELKGERSERREPRVLRIVRAECRLCERRRLVFFDVSRLYH